jgi:hypothetical protein
VKLNLASELFATDFAGYPNVVCVQIVAFSGNPKSLCQFEQVRARTATDLKNTEILIPAAGFLKELNYGRDTVMRVDVRGSERSAEKAGEGVPVKAARVISYGHATIAGTILSTQRTFH